MVSLGMSAFFMLVSIFVLSSFSTAAPPSATRASVPLSSLARFLLPEYKRRLNQGRLPSAVFEELSGLDFEDSDLMDFHDSPKRQFDDYGHMRFGKREFDDYGHLRFGRSSNVNSVKSN